MPKGKKFNAEDRRQRRSAGLWLFVKATGRKAQKDTEPNDRSFERKTTLSVRHMRAADLDDLLRDGEER